MTPARAPRPLCSELSREREEPISATASRVVSWILVEYAGRWPSEPLDAAPFGRRLRAHLAAQLEALPASRLCLIKRARRDHRNAGVTVVYGTVSERTRPFFRLELSDHTGLLDLDFAAALAGRGAQPGERLEHPLLLVCTHGLRDRCCARFGQALCREVSAHEDPAWTWQSTHVGGDRFAGNLVCLPEGLYFGRVEDATERVLAAYRRGRIELDRYRGRSCWSFPVQAAERAIRETANLTGFDDLRLEAQERTGPGRWRVRMLAVVAGDVHEVDVEAVDGEETILTCKAGEPRRPRRFVARAHRVSPG